MGRPTAHSPTKMAYFTQADKTKLDSLSPSGGVTAASSVVFQATLSSTTQNTNATPSHDYTWNSSTKDTSHVTHTDGQAAVELTAGEYDIYPEIVVTDGQANNRQTFALYLDHTDNDDVSIYEYLVGSGVYIRDDASTYDSGAAAGHIRLVVSAGDKVIVRTKRLDAQTGAGNNYANQTQSRLRILRVTYS